MLQALARLVPPSRSIEEDRWPLRGDTTLVELRIRISSCRMLVTHSFHLNHREWTPIDKFTVTGHSIERLKTYLDHNEIVSVVIQSL